MQYRDIPTELNGRPLGDIALPTSGVGAPITVSTRRGRLYYNLEGSHGPPYRAVRARGMLDRFIRMQTDDDVAEFARRYGVLGLCAHGLPVDHEPVTGRRRCRIAVRRRVASEGIADWMRWRDGFNAYLRLIPELRIEQPGANEDWRVVLNLVPDLATWVERSYGDAADSDVVRRYVLERVLGWLLQWGRVGWHVDWLKASRPRAELFVPTTFGQLALQLALTLSRASDLAICSGCDVPYVATRQPSPGRRHYCPRCRADGRVAARNRQRDHRARARAPR